jgi:DMSO reductase family type II enzyme heme b subunit
MAALVGLGAFPGVAGAQAGDPGAGKAVYEQKCRSCHGEKGDGQGPGAERLDPRPRDFTAGLYKIRSTRTKTPSDQDLFAIITKGMPGTSMPAWANLPETDRWNLVAYIKAFAPDKFTEPAERMELPPEVGSSAASIARGKEMYEAIECNKCHGTAGRGDGPSMPELKDEWGHPIRPANLTERWNFRGGASRADVAMRLATGVLGTPMPSFIDSVEKPEDIWHLANYVASLGPETVRFATLVPVAAGPEAIPEDPNAEFWTTIAPARIPLMGQVIVDSRNFSPSIGLLTVRGAYNEREIAFHLTWDDPTRSVADPGQGLYADAVSIQFPSVLEAGPERPYFLMGDDSSAVYLLGWEAGGGAREATANGPGRITPLAGSAATATIVFDDGQYRLVLRRPRRSSEAGRPGFEPARFIPVAFQAWDGGAGETGTKMSLTSWYYLRLDEPRTNRRFIVPPLVALGTLAVMGLAVWAANRRG